VGGRPETVRSDLARVLDRRDGAWDTTNLVTVDADGNACVLTSSLGLGAGDWLPGLDLHLNSMLGEADLIREPLRARRADGQHDVAGLALDADGPSLAGGAAGGTRCEARSCRCWRHARRGPLGRTGRRAAAAASGSRCRTPRAGLPDNVPRALEAAGYRVRVWPDRHHYFGVSASLHGPARRVTRGEAVQQRSSLPADRRPAEVPALRTARVHRGGTRRPGFA
jgi:gamma-glutamyltranspeptidase/glutathione hydrolase